MRSTFGKLMLATLALGALSAVSMASDTNYTIRLGTFAPGDTDMRNATTNFWFAAGLDRKINRWKGWFDSSSYLSVSADFFERAGNRSIPVTVNLNFPTAGFTYFIGAGVQFTKLAGTNRNVTAMAATVGATYELSNRFNVTAKYFVAGNPRLRGFGFFIGFKL